MEQLNEVLDIISDFSVQLFIIKEMKISSRFPLFFSFDFFASFASS